MMESVQPIESWLRTQADVVKQRGSMANYDGRYHERMEEAADRIRELEASVREWSDRAMEFSNLASKYEEELAAVRQRTLAIDRFHKCGGDSEQDPIERLRFFCSLAMNGQDWLDVEQFFDALRQQQGEPVAWRFKNNSGDAVTIWIDYVPQEIESVERQAREAGGRIEYAYNREAASKQQGEPVAWRYKMNRAHSAWTLLGFPPAGLPNGAVVEELYREAAPRVPDGWQKTPSEIISEAISATVLEHPDEWLSVTATFRQNTSGIGVIDDLCIRVAGAEGITMPLDYNEAKKVFHKKMGDKLDSAGAMDTALLAFAEFVYQHGLSDGMQAVLDADRHQEIFSKT